MASYSPGMDDDDSSTRKQKLSETVPVQSRINALDLQDDRSNQLAEIIQGSTCTSVDCRQTPPTTRKSQLFKSARAIQHSAVASPKKGSNRIFNTTGTRQISKKMEKCVIPSKSTMYTPRLGTAETGAESGNANSESAISYFENRLNRNRSKASLSTESSNHYASSVNKKALDIVSKRHTTRFTSASRKPPANSEDISPDKQYPLPCDDGNGGSEEFVVGSNQEYMNLHERVKTTESALTKKSNSPIKNDRMKQYSTNIKVEYYGFRVNSLKKWEETLTTEVDKTPPREDLLLVQQNDYIVKAIESDESSIENENECDLNYSPQCHHPRHPSSHQSKVEGFDVHSSPIPPRQLLGYEASPEKDSVKRQHDSSKRAPANGADFNLAEIIQNDSSLQLSMEENEPYYVGTVAPTYSSSSIQKPNNNSTMSRDALLLPDQDFQGKEELSVPSPPSIMRTLSTTISPRTRANQSKFGNSINFPFMDDSPCNESTELLPGATNDAITKRIFQRVVRKCDTSVSAMSPVSMAETSSGVGGGNLEGISIISGSTNTTTSYATSHMTSLSTRATRFLKEKRKANNSSIRANNDAGKDSTSISEEFAKDLVQSILTRKSTKEQVNQKVLLIPLDAKNPATSNLEVDQSVGDTNTAENDNKIDSQSVIEVEPRFTSLNEKIGNQRRYDDRDFVDFNHRPEIIPHNASFQLFHDNSQLHHDYDGTKYVNRGESHSSDSKGPSCYNSFSYQNQSSAEDTLSYNSESRSPLRRQRHRRNSEGRHDYTDADSDTSFDSFLRGNSFDVGQLPSRLLDVVHSACDTLSPTNHALLRDRNSYGISSKKNHVVAIWSTETRDEAPSDEDVAIEVEYVDPSFMEDHDSRVSDSVYSYSTSEDITGSNSIH
ncbi:hypothetical protein ACHAXS_005748 [Conticribra weissflogii]